MKDTSKKQQFQGDQIIDADPNAILSFTEVQRLLYICLQIEDQLWAMTQTVNVPKEIRDLWPSHHLRQHTALGRLKTMIYFQDSEQPMKLAELGLMNTSDK